MPHTSFINPVNSMKGGQGSLMGRGGEGLCPPQADGRPGRNIII